MASVSRWAMPTSFGRPSLIPLATAGVLLMLASVTYRLQGYGFEALMPMLAIIAICLGCIVLLRPAIGVVVLIGSASFLRFSIGTGTNSALVASLLCAMLLVTCWVAHRLIEGKKLILLPNVIAIPAIVLACATTFSFLWGRLVLDPRIQVSDTFYRVQIGQALLTLVSLGLLFASADVLRSRTLRNFLVLTYLFVGAAALPIRWFGWDDRGLNSGGLFGLWFVALSWSYALSNNDLSRWIRLALGSLTFGWLWMAYFREGTWVSGWLPGVIAVLIITIIARPRLGAMLTTAAVAGIAFYYSILYDVLITTQKTEGSLGGDFGRLELIQRNLGLIKEHLLLGTGPAGYALYYVTFFPDKAMSTHNNYVDILSQNGIAGLLSFVALLFGLAILAIRLVPHISDHSDRSLTIALAGGVPALILALWLGDWLIPFVYNQTIGGFDHAVYSWLMLCCLCGLYAQYRGKEGADA